MAVVSLDTIKGWFRTGLRPTQAQFWDSWDSFWHKGDSISMSSIEGLETAFSNLEFPTIDATGFRQKAEKSEAYIYGTGETTMSALPSASYRIMGGFTEIHGIVADFALLYLGREHTFFNAQATDVILKHGITDASLISFDFPNGEDIALLPGQMIKVKFVKTIGYFLELVSKNFSTIIDNLLQSNIELIDYPSLTQDFVQTFEIPAGKIAKQVFINKSQQLFRETENNIGDTDTFSQLGTTITINQPTEIGNYIGIFIQ